ncbi:hypothetical protein AAHK20_33125 [Trinickia sp. YCB016]
MEQRSATGRSMISRFMPFRHVSRRREIVRQFTPNWFAMTMGTGIVSIVLPFAVDGTVLAVATMGFWFIVIANTLKGMWLGNLFRAPCLIEPLESALRLGERRG